MRRQLVAIAAAACLATTACTTTDPAETPTPTDVTTTEVATTEPATTETTDTETPADETETPVDPSTDDGDSEATGEDVDLADQTFAVTPQEAIDNGVAEAGEGIVHSIELDWSRHHNAWVYELDVLAGNVDHDIDINADTGEILEHEQDDTDDQEQAIDLDSPMTWEAARDKALEAVQGRITSWKLEWDDDYASYEFDIEDSTGDEVEVEINVNTGTVSIDD